MAKFGQDPSGVSLQQALAAVRKAWRVKGANTACVPMSMVQESIKESILERAMVYK
mgnify:FL=1